ncbi:alpha/beta fold hydrolase [Aquibacillus koreensis]|uniref:Alpha/beta fold hydrolase n=1 Tax=Aquibacillus koreensis TaxID=279446 RepID=A0A9X4AIN2_9BACI|nr:alpha/beta fold hydrolase [Aquibacillus koreensis]MCT2534814.1 alpha/beta fold hydrolase [Aquibacillus koreensis]MDC3419575.1 alpha/beta fold hydrolase [Aquibacillus koreensis]
MMNKNKRFFSRPLAIIVSLVVILISSIIAHSVQTSGGDVEVKDIRFVGDNGIVHSALMYMPSDMNLEEQYPAVVSMHGYINSREVQEPFSIEFAKRGYIVLSLDMTGHGYSEQFPADLSRGVTSGLHYLHNLPFIDGDQVAVEGHSMGGWSVLKAATDNPELVNTVIQVSSSTETFGSGEVTAETPFNYAILFSEYDEFSLTMWGTEKAADVNSTEKMMKIFGVEEPVEEGELYGSFEDQSARMFLAPPVIHPGTHWSTESIGVVLEFLNNAIPAPNPIDSDQQTWKAKEFATLAGLIGAIMLLISVLGNLLRTSYFANIVRELPESKAVSNKWVWIVSGVVATVIPAVTFIKFIELGQNWFPAGPILRQNFTSGFAVWAIFNAAIATILLTIFHYTNKKNAASLKHYGFTMEWKLIGKTILLAAASVGTMYSVTVLVGAFFNIDFRIWVMPFKAMTASHFYLFLTYLLPFLIFFIVNGLVLHGQLRMKESGTETKTFLKWFGANFLINALGIIVLLVIQYSVMYFNGALLWDKALITVIAFQFVFINILAALVSTYLFRKTGTIWAGAFVNAFLITWYIVAGQVMHM